MLSDFTHAWQLYLGAFFILIVVYAPGGIASVVMLNLRVVKFGKFGRIGRPMLVATLLALVTAAGGVMIVEMLYHLTLESINGTRMKLFGVMVDTAAPGGWLIAAALLLAGGAGFRRAKKLFARAWDEVNTEIEEQIRRAEA